MVATLRRPTRHPSRWPDRANRLLNSVLPPISKFCQHEVSVRSPTSTSRMQWRYSAGKPFSEVPQRCHDCRTPGIEAVQLTVAGERFLGSRRMATRPRACSVFSTSPGPLRLSSDGRCCRAPSAVIGEEHFCDVADKIKVDCSRIGPLLQRGDGDRVVSEGDH